MGIYLIQISLLIEINLMVITKNYQVGLDTSDSLQFQGGPAGRYSIRENNLGFAHAISYLDIDHDGHIVIFL